MEQPPEACLADCVGQLAGVMESWVSALVRDGAAMKPGRRLCIALPRDANLAPHPLQYNRAVGCNQTFDFIVKISNKNNNDSNNTSSDGDNKHDRGDDHSDDDNNSHTNFCFSDDNINIDDQTVLLQLMIWPVEEAKFDWRGNVDAPCGCSLCMNHSHVKDRIQRDVAR